MTNNPNRQNVVKRIRWAARIIGLLTAALFLMFLIGETVIKMAMQQEGLMEGVSKAMLVIVAVAGCIISWWRQRVGASLLILAYFLMIVSFYLCGGFPVRSPLWLMLGLPFLIAGVLFLISSWLSRKTDLSVAEKEGQMQEQKEPAKRRSIATFILWGAVGFGSGGAVGGIITVYTHPAMAF